MNKKKKEIKRKKKKEVELCFDPQIERGVVDRSGINVCNQGDKHRRNERVKVKGTGVRNEQNLQIDIRDPIVYRLLKRLVRVVLLQKKPTSQ